MREATLQYYDCFLPNLFYFTIQFSNRCLAFGKYRAILPQFLLENAKYNCELCLICWCVHVSLRDLKMILLQEKSQILHGIEARGSVVG
jgi:hypothetical protein